MPLVGGKSGPVPKVQLKLVQNWVDWCGAAGWPEAQRIDLEPPMDHQDRQYTKCTPESTSSTTGTMLLISPSTKDLDRMNSQLESLGYECLVAETIEAARATLDSVSIDIIAIASSLVAPAPLRVIREAQSQRPWLRAVVFGGAPNPETVVEAIRQGVSDWINLPVDRARLPERIAQIMDRVAAHRQREAQLETLEGTCRELSEARTEMSDQVDVLCGDLASAYKSMHTQMSEIAMSAEFRTLLSQELDVEDMLRTSLEYVLKKLGPTNAVVFLQEAPGQYGVGAYVNYQWPNRDIMPTLRLLGSTLCPSMSTERELVRFDDASEFAAASGEDAKLLNGSQVVAFSCFRGDECLAVFTLFRDAENGFGDDDAEMLDVLGQIIAEQLTRIIRVHQRSRPEWPSEPSEGDWDIAA